MFPPISQAINSHTRIRTKRTLWAPIGSPSTISVMSWKSWPRAPWRKSNMSCCKVFSTKYKCTMSDLRQLTMVKLRQFERRFVLPGCVDLHWLSPGLWALAWKANKVLMPDLHKFTEASTLSGFSQVRKWSEEEIFKVREFYNWHFQEKSGKTFKTPEGWKKHLSHWSQRYFHLMKKENLLKTYKSYGMSGNDYCKFTPEVATRSDILSLNLFGQWKSYFLSGKSQGIFIVMSVATMSTFRNL